MKIVIIVTWLLCRTLANTNGQNETCPEGPQVNVIDHYPSTNITFLEGETSTAYFPEKVFITLECTSRQPVYWDYENPQLNQFRFIRPKRTSTDPLKSDSFCFRVSLFLYSFQDSTGKYTCRTLADPSHASALSIFVDEQTESPFVVSSEVLQLKLNRPQVQDDWLLIPCKVRSPYIKVDLYQNDTEKIEIESSVLQWEPAVGFYLNVLNHPDYTGSFTCRTTVGDRTFQQILTIERQEVLSDIRLPFENGRGYVCRSSDADRELKLMHKRCTNLMECWNAQNRYISPEDEASQLSSADPRGLSIKQPSEPGSEMATGLFQCVVSGSGNTIPNSRKIYQFASLATGLTANMTDEIVNRTLLPGWIGPETAQFTRVKIQNDSGIKSQEFFTGTTHEFICRAARFVTAEGLDWVFEMSDGTTLGKAQVKIDEVHYEDRTIALRGYSFYSVIRVNLWSSNITRIKCLAPMWSNHEWYDHSVDIMVKESTTPVIEPTSFTELQFSVHKPASINCTARGIPRPVIIWEKVGANKLPAGVQINNSVGLGGDENEVRYELKSTLFFESIAKEMEGEYICMASSPGGMDNQTFSISVKEAKKSLTVIIMGAGLVVGVLLVLVVYLYRRTLLQKKLIGQILSEKELNEFFHGCPEMLTDKKRLLPEYAQFMPYNKDYEISPSKVRIEQEALLGSGQYGMVYKGQLDVNEARREVAVKTLKPCAEKDYVKALLSEIKIMLTVGGHPNVVNFLGAVTEDLRDGKLLIIIEFCALGSLDSYLQSHRDEFVDLIQNDAICPLPEERRVSATKRSVSESHTEALNTWDLTKWALQIASGMEYLSQKKVVHADLACRNVLLTREKVAKITDFGLSRQLYQSSDYVKKTQVPLPWRHMALESLKDMNFSAASDVWAYGVTLWELYSLGAVPFPGYVWDIDFLKQVEDGLRMQKPEHATTGIYQLMMKCWERDPLGRPCFTVLKNYFEVIISEKGRTKGTADYYHID